MHGVRQETRTLNINRTGGNPIRSQHRTQLSRRSSLLGRRCGRILSRRRVAGLGMHRDVRRGLGIGVPNVMQMQSKLAQQAVHIHSPKGSELGSSVTSWSKALNFSSLRPKEDESKSPAATRSECKAFRDCPPQHAGFQT